tara:strand:+ start:253 stop:570 length:318 start_codon:yes stop_codon:yes gene_type:complete
MTDKKRIRYIIPCECDHYKSGVIEEHHHFEDNPDIIVDWRDYDDDDYLLIEKKKVWIVVEGRTINDDGIEYQVSDGIAGLRTESHDFNNLEEATEYCKKLNQEAE